jgi:hypothetical protein
MTKLGFIQVLRLILARVLAEPGCTPLPRHRS